MKRFGTGITLLLVFAIVRDADATSTEQYNAPGDTCHVYGISDSAVSSSNTLTHYDYIQNTGTANLLVYCGVPVTTPVGASVPVEYGVVSFYDGSSTASVNCVPLQRNGTTGSSVQGQSIYSCSTGGGCSSASPSYTGYNSLNWFSGGFNLGFTSFSSAQGFLCTLAPSSKIFGTAFEN
jgi:hypothetical protein